MDEVEVLFEEEALLESALRFRAIRSSHIICEILEHTGSRGICNREEVILSQNLEVVKSDTYWKLRCALHNSHARKLSSCTDHGDSETYNSTWKKRASMNFVCKDS